jgi:hypothetical protein
MKNIGIIISVILFTSCNYREDKLTIQNNSNKDICCETLIRGIKDSAFYPVSAGIEISPNSGRHPLVRNGILNEMKDQSLDKVLYLVYYNCNDKEFVYKNFKNIIFNKKYLVHQYSINKLDSLNWVVKYQH